MALSVSILALVFLLIPALITLLALVDLVRYDATVWASAGESQLVWALVVVFVPLLGPIVYLAAGRPKLRRAALNGASGPFGLGA